MENEKPLEYWMSGPITGVPDLLQPVAHALLQMRREVNECMKNFPEALLWQKPAGVAAPAFHLQHIPGVIDRMFTYARGEALSKDQFRYLTAEGRQQDEIDLPALLNRLNDSVETALAELSGIAPETLTHFRGIGRKQLPGTVLSLLFHAAEHAMRHTGQLLVTVAILRREGR